MKWLIQLVLFPAYMLAECLGLGMSYIRLLNRLGIRRDNLVCMRKANTYIWGSHLGPRTEGTCDACGEPICYEKQNQPFRKICHVCAPPPIEVIVLEITPKP